MKTAKQEIRELLEILPDEMALDDILDRIEFKARILHSQEQAARGEGVPHEEVMPEIEQWARFTWDSSRDLVPLRRSE